ncbi:MAG TPA: hypothetical protein VF432_04650 [Thermoanaerobaculia bacterium]
MAERNLQDLFDNSKSEGALSDDSHQLLTLPDLGAKIQQGLGVAVDDIPSSEVFMVTLLVDDSGSISSAGNERIVMDGYNEIVAALRGSKEESGILIHTRFLNGKVLTAYTPIDQAVALDATNYQANGSTPLYDESVALLGTVIAKTQELADAGVPSRSVTVIITDGADCGSHRHDARAVKAIVRDMLKAEAHIVAAVGLSDGSTDFRRVFREMGIEDRWILTPGVSKSDIRAAFRLISQTAVRTSQGRTAFGAAGGFGG